LTVLWSIIKTWSKAKQILAEEHRKGALELSLEETLNHSLIHNTSLEIDRDTASPAIIAILDQEKHHFTKHRAGYVIICFMLLLVMQVLIQMKESFEWYWVYVALAVYSAMMIYLTKHTADRVYRNQITKVEAGYRFDKNDIVFNNTQAVIKLAFFCFVASTLCACAGIAGGMVYAPLFLSYNMIPQCMSATQSMLTLVESFSIFLQFEYIGAENMNLGYTFGILTLLSAFVGINGVNSYIR